MDNKILIVSEKYEQLEELFKELMWDYQVLTTSVIYEDMANHAKTFMPDVIMVVLENMSDNAMSMIGELKIRVLENLDIPIAILGTPSEMECFKNKTESAESFMINSSFPFFAIKSQLDMFVEKENEKRLDAVEKSFAGGVKKKILVIDDSSLILKVIREELKEWYDVTVVTSGDLGINFLKTKNVDLIVLDYDMPDKDGVQVLREIREYKRLKTIPVIFLTGVSDRQKITRALSMGIQGYLLKPINGKKLHDMIRKCLAEKNEEI